MKHTISTKRKIVELKIAAFIAEHCSNKTADHLSSLINNLDENSALLNGVKIHRTKCTALISNIIAPCLLEDLIADVGNEKYSLIIDESTAVDCAKMMCLMIRYFSKSRQKIVTLFYRLIEIEAGDAATLVEALQKHLNKDGLPLKNLIGIGVDGANVMVGKNNSVSTMLRSMTNENFVTIKCVCHSLHLAAEHAFKILPKHLDFLIKETHNWFSCSSKRQIEYRKLYTTMNEKRPKQIDKLSGTRWLARYNAIDKIIEQWDVLKLHFELAREKERCYVAQQLYEMFSDRRNYLYLVFLRNILKDLVTVNKAFQSETANSLKLMDDLLQLLKRYLSILIPPIRLEKIGNNELINLNFKDYVMSVDFQNFGYSFNEASVGMDKAELTNIRQRCSSFLIELCNQIQYRLPANIDILEKINFLTPENATSQVRKPDITALASNFKSICEDVDSTINEWNCLHRIEWTELEDSEAFWIEVSHNKNAVGETRFGNITKLAIALLSLPFSNAAVERAFSVVNIIKDKLRNRLSIISTEAILRVRFHLINTSCAAFEPSEKMLKIFNKDMYQTSAENLCALDVFADIMD